MVRMHVGDEDAPDGQSPQWSGNGRSPGVSRHLGLNARIDYSPAVTISNRVNINKFQ